MNATDGIEARYLPPLLQEIAQLIGLSKTLLVIARYGGIPLRVPAQFDPTHPLCAILGHEAGAALMARFRGERLEIPRGVIAQKAVRDRHIRDMRGVKPQWQLALEHQLTARQVRNIQGPPEPDARQAMLPGIPLE
jgi:hypothetical protein